MFVPAHASDALAASAPTSTLNMVSFQEMTTEQVDRYAELAWELGCPLHLQPQPGPISVEPGARQACARCWPLLLAARGAAARRCRTRACPSRRRLRSRSARRAGGSRCSPRLAVRLPARGRMAPRLDVSAASVVLGVPLYGNGEHLHEALESLLAQTQPALALVLCDDGPGEGARAVVEAVAAGDPRVTYRRNERRLGSSRTGSRTFEVAGELHPGGALFRAGRAITTPAIRAGPSAWWTPWSGRRRRCWRTAARTSSTRTGTSCTRWTVSTPPASPDPRERLAGALRHMRAGDMVYGVYRREPMQRCGHHPQPAAAGPAAAHRAQRAGRVRLRAARAPLQARDRTSDARPSAGQPVRRLGPGVRAAAVVARAHRSLRLGDQPWRTAPGSRTRAG